MPQLLLPSEGRGLLLLLLHLQLVHLESAASGLDLLLGAPNCMRPATWGGTEQLFLLFPAVWLWLAQGLWLQRNALLPVFQPLRPSFQSRGGVAAWKEGRLPLVQFGMLPCLLAAWLFLLLRLMLLLLLPLLLLLQVPVCQQVLLLLLT